MADRFVLSSDGSIIDMESTNEVTGRKRYQCGDYTPAHYGQYEETRKVVEALNKIQ